jgi:signal transduction histidine kinase
MHDSLAGMTQTGRPAPWWPDLARLAAAGGLCVLLLFLVWEGAERTFVRDDRAAHRVHYARGISTSLLTAGAVGLVGWRQHRRREAGLAALVTERAQDARAARELLERVVDANPAALLVLDGERRVVRANRMAEQVHGGPLVGGRCHEALLGRHERCAECAGPGAFARALACPASGTHTDPRTGEVLAVETHPLQLPDGNDYVLLVERVVTEQKKLQARLLHQEKMAAFGLLAAGVAHELGNPLASVEAQLQLLDEARLAREDVPVVATVRQEVARLRRTLREMVDFARRRRDEATLVSVQAVVGDALRLLRHDPRMRRVRTREEFDAETPPVFMVEDHLMQVVLNLLLNALDAMPAGGTLRIELRPAGEQVALRVHDTGIGMDRATLGHCFEPLFTTKDPGKGTGLGLSLSRDILRAVSGEIELHSAPGKGTTAVVTLPAAAAPNAARPAIEGRVA